MKEKEFDRFVAKPAAGTEEKKYPGLIVIHEIWGLNDHIRDVARRYAEQGFVVIAPDLLGGSGILEKMSPNLYEDMRNPEKRHAAQAKMRELMQPISTKEFSNETLGKLGSCFEYLSEQAECSKNIGILGFCFGGTYSFFFATQEPRLKAAVVFYGRAPMPLETVASITCPVLGFYGEQDENLMKSLPDIEKAMKDHGKKFTSKIYKNTGHAFFNDTNARAFNKEARDNAWEVSLSFLKQHLS